MPVPYDNCVLEMLHNIVLQFTRPVDAFMYIALRRYFIVRNNMPIDFGERSKIYLY